MKKFTSFLLIFAMLISIIYLPGIKIDVSASGDGVETELPVGTMTASPPKETPLGYMAISSEEDFKKIGTHTKTRAYYLTTNLDLTKSGGEF